MVCHPLGIGLRLRTQQSVMAMRPMRMNRMPPCLEYLITYFTLTMMPFSKVAFAYHVCGAG